MDLKTAARFIGQFSPEKSTTWYFSIRDAIDSFENFPFRCPFVPERKTLRAEIQHLLFGDYRILYPEIDETVHVLRVLHQAPDVLRPVEDE